MDMDLYKEESIIIFIRKLILELNCNSKEDDINNVCISLSSINDNKTKNILFDLLLNKIVIIRADQITMFTLISNEIDKLNDLDNVDYIASCILNITNEKNRNVLNILLINKKSLLELQNKPKSKHLNLSEMFRNKQKNNNK